MNTETSSRSRSSSQPGPSKLPDTIWAPLTAGFLILVVGAIGLLVNQPWLFPALGPTAFLQSERPDLKSSRFYNVVVGHLCGMVAGILAIAVLGATNAPGVLEASSLTPVRMWASVVAMVLTTLGCLLLKANHPPAAATTLLFSLGGFAPMRQDITTVIVSVLILAAAGEILRQVRLRQTNPS